MKKKSLLLLYLFLPFINISCTNSSSQSEKRSKIVHQYITDYEVYQMDAELKEISGITFINDSTIAAIEDENGIVYFYDLNKKKVSRKLEFAKPGDFEDLVAVGKDLYVVNSDGKIYWIKDFAQDEPKITKYKTPLSKKNDIESITYDAENNALLLAVKAENLLKEKKNKSIYSFDLKTETFKEEPYLDIKHKDLESYFKGDAWEEASKEFLKLIGNENLNKIITPTAIAFHPIDKDLYVLSSVSNIILVYSPQKILKKVITFKGKEFTQAEGLSFNSQGQLFISNEGKKISNGNIIQVKSIK